MPPTVRIVREHDLRKLRSALARRGDRMAASADLPLRTDRITLEELSIDSNGTADWSIGRPGDLEPGTATERHLAKAEFLARTFDELGRIPEAERAARWRALDAEVRRDARFVLIREERVPDEPTDAELYSGFAAWFAEVRRFAPSALPYFFPSMRDEVAFAECPQLGIEPPAADVLVSSHPLHSEAPKPVPIDPTVVRTLAESSLKKGNAARAAIAAAVLKDDVLLRTALGEHLVPALAEDFGWDAERSKLWAVALEPVARAAAMPGWTPAAKFLFELQRLGTDLGHDLYSVDPGMWVGSLGRRPLLRKMTLQRRAILLVHLRRAAKPLERAALEPTHREALEKLFHHEQHAADAALRAEYAPVIRDTLDRAGIVPHNTAEEVAREKVIAELLDRIVERGHIRLADLRDGLARNALKLPDLAGPVELLTGDPLLRADKELARNLDGAYHRGEIYLRWFQRGSAFFFGTVVGRAITLFGLIAFLAAFMTVAFSQYLEHEATTVAGLVGKLVRKSDPEPVEYYAVQDEKGEWDWVAEGVKAHKAIDIDENAWIAIGILTVVNLLLLNWPAFRRAVIALLKNIGLGIRFVFAVLPGKIWRSPPLMALRRNRYVRLSVNRVLLPALLAALAAGIAALFGGSRALILRYFLGAFAIAAIVANTPVGRRLRNNAEATATDFWIALRYNLLPGLISIIVWYFKSLLGALDSLLYTVDEWLRYRQGQSKPSLALKVAFAFLWFPIAYVVRFAVFLLIEPQLNPLKHFPVVTVSHKLLIPMIPSVSSALGFSEGLVGLVFLLIPGVFGFLVWELKENWKLYAANRPKCLPPVILGHHGETMRGLLRPGFHSGTIPADYRKIRAAVRTAQLRDTDAIVPKPLHSLKQVEHAIHDFAERELIATLDRCQSWRGMRPECAAMHLGVQSIAVDIRRDDTTAKLVFALQDGEIIAWADDAAFVAGLPPTAAKDWRFAVKGFFALGAVANSTTCDEWRNHWEKSKNPGRGAGVPSGDEGS